MTAPSSIDPARVLHEHTAAHRAEELEGYALKMLAWQAA